LKTYIKLWIICTGIVTSAYAQQRPQYTQYVFNNFLLNPALSGIENYIDIKAGFRKQWVGINDAPQTSFVSANWKLGDDYLWRNALSLPDKGDDPMGRNYMQNYTASPSHHGVGVVAVLDKLGPLSRLDANLTYAYHLQATQTLNVSVGVAAGISSISFDISALEFEDKSSDPATSNTLANQIRPDLSIGIWVYGANFFAGASVQQILSQKLAFTKDASYTQGQDVPHAFLTAGYRFPMGEEFSITPSVMLKRVTPVPLSIDANLKVGFKDRLWIGGSYRRNDSYAALAGMNISKLFNLTYSYDLTTSDLNTVTNGTHEIVLGVQLNNVYEVFSKQRMW
jgi:type IX secretion system PorP/SprF family membrane protein